MPILGIVVHLPPRLFDCIFHEGVALLPNRYKKRHIIMKFSASLNYVIDDFLTPATKLSSIFHKFIDAAS